jgi:SAM-dependent methyltransferase
MVERPQRSESLVGGSSTNGLGAISIAHPPGTFALTPASLISIDAIASNQDRLSGSGIDWGTGSGCLAILASRIEAVDLVIGLDIVPANVEIARMNALQNGAKEKTRFMVADSYLPQSEADRNYLHRLRGRTDFILANPPASDYGDGFGFRRAVLDGGLEYLKPGGVVFLCISSQYGGERIHRLVKDVPGYEYDGIASSTDWTPFDLRRPDLLTCLRLYAAEEKRGGYAYEFRGSGTSGQESAEEALCAFETNGTSPMMMWQTHLFAKI